MPDGSQGKVLFFNALTTIERLNEQLDMLMPVSKLQHNLSSELSVGLIECYKVFHIKFYVYNSDGVAKS